jgi:DNA-binding transcriptional ArsR family regulator
MDPDIASLAALIGEPARARILFALLDGRGLPASELAKRACVTCQTASSHLSKLKNGSLLQVIDQGRHRYYRIANARVAELLESMARLAPMKEGSTPDPAMRSPIQIARTCYNHLAGHLGVAITKAIVDRGLLKEIGRDYQLTKCGAHWFTDFGIDPDSVQKSGRIFAKQCHDWSERRNHLAGALGSAMAERLFELEWIKRVQQSRAVKVTESGQRELRKWLGLELEI